jgi:hypothetical protein
VNESRIHALALTYFKDDPVEVLVAGGRNVRRNLELSRTRDGHRGQHMTKQDAGHVRKDEEEKKSEWRKLQRTEMGYSAGKLHPEQSPGLLNVKGNFSSGAATQMVHIKPAVAFSLRFFHP